MASRFESFSPRIEAPIPCPQLKCEPSPSIISPLTLPRGVSGYFDQVVALAGAPSTLVPHGYGSPGGAALRNSRANQVYSPLSPGLKGPAVGVASFLSPNLLPTSKEGPSQFSQLRLSSPSAGNGLSSSPGPAVVHSLINGGSSFPGGYPLSPSVDPSGASPHAHANQRLVQQNARIREAWEAERKHLEANRQRAEEVYREERALMEEERAEWDTERAALMEVIARLRQVVHTLGGDAALRRNGSDGNSSSTSPLCPNCGVRGGLGDPSRSSRDTSRSSRRSLSPSHQSGAPVVGPSQATSDFLKPADGPSADAGPVPVIDVQTIHPELEGIPIKVTNAQKATFKDSPSPNGSRASSLDRSSPLTSDQAKSPQQPTLSLDAASPPTSSDEVKSPEEKKGRTLQVLAAAEVDRLVMHAGHTPSHSLSALASVPCSGTTTQTSSGGGSTPTMPHAVVAVVAPRPLLAAVDQSSSAGTSNAAESRGRLASDDLSHPADEYHPEPIFEPRNDVHLKGPLMVRNMPVHDEIFFRALNDKLEEVSKDGEASLPAVLKGSEPATHGGGGEQHQPAEKASSDSAESEGGSNKSDSVDSAGSSTATSGDELDVPLKFKKRMNFGAPFGEMQFSKVRGTRPSFAFDEDLPGVGSA